MNTAQQIADQIIAAQMTLSDQLGELVLQDASADLATKKRAVLSQLSSLVDAESAAL